MKKIINIEGTYGDPVKLYANGYIYTKYGDFLKIKQHNESEKSVSVYGEDCTYDYSRISCSVPRKKESDIEYDNNILRFLSKNGIKSESIIEYTNELGVCINAKIVNIVLSYKTDKYLPTLVVKNTKNDEMYNIQIKYLVDFAENLIDVVYTPFTTKEKIEQIIAKHVNFGNTIKDMDSLVDKLSDLVENQK